MVVENGGHCGHGVFGGAGQVVVLTGSIDDAWGIEIEDIAIEDEREGLFADGFAQVFEHFADFGIGYRGALTITHPFTRARFDFAEVNIGNHHGMAHRTEMTRGEIMWLSGKSRTMGAE